MSKKQSEQTSQSEYIVEATAISKTYHTGQTSIGALKDVSLQIKRGEIVAIMGPSGSGKTTLLNCLSGLDNIDSGAVKIVGRDLKKFSDNKLSEFRAQQMGFIFQTYNLLPVLTGIENVELPLLISGVKSKVARRRAMEAIEQVGLADRASHKPAEMSGGQCQRITIARALATRPAIVWADEPTGALDTKTSQEIMELMIQLNTENNLTFVWVTHSSAVANMAQRLIQMCDGQIIEDSKVPHHSQTLSV